jgi:hypothetical protein
LPHQSKFVKSAPTLDNRVVLDSEHLHAFKDKHFAGGWYAHQVAAVSTARGEALNNDVCLGDELFHFAVPVWERLVKHGGCLPHALSPVWCTGERWVVIDESWVQVSVGGVQVTFGEQLLDECLDNLLVCGGSIGCHSQIVRPSMGSRPSHKVGIS